MPPPLKSESQLQITLPYIHSHRTPIEIRPQPSSAKMLSYLNYPNIEICKKTILTNIFSFVQTFGVVSWPFVSHSLLDLLCLYCTVSVQLGQDSGFCAKIVCPEVRVPTYRTDFCILI